MNRIVINGKEMNIQGSNFTIKNNKVFVDGKEIANGDDIQNANTIFIYGDVKNIETDKSVNCNDVSGDVYAKGSVNCDNIKGNLSAGGSVNCDDVGGSITAGGSVNCG